MTRAALPPGTAEALARLLSHPDVQGVTVEEQEGRPVELGLLRRSTLTTSWFHGRDLAECVARARDTFHPRVYVEEGIDG